MLPAVILIVVWAAVVVFWVVLLRRAVRASRRAFELALLGSVLEDLRAVTFTSGR